MVFNTCCTGKTFESEKWMAVYNEFHRDLRFDSLPVEGEDAPTPSMFHEYWNYLWDRDPARIGQEFCSPKNLKGTHRIWEYVHTLACIYYNNQSTLKGRKILSLGAGVESPLWTLSRWGAEVDASDTYFERGYWHRRWVPSIKKNPGVFSPYSQHYPLNFINLNLAKPAQWKKVGTYDVIYSISSIEHVHEDMDEKIEMFEEIVKHLRVPGVLTFTTELITAYEVRRRKDFYTRDELERVIAVLSGHGLALVDKPLWETASEQEESSDGCIGQKHTAISLTFRRA